MIDWTTAPENSESPSVTRRCGRTNRRTSSKPISAVAASDRMIVGPRMTRGASSMVRVLSANARHIQPFAPVGRYLVLEGLAPHLEHLLRGGRGKQVHEPRDDSGPAGLVAGAQPGAVVAVEVLVEQHVVAPVRIVLEGFRCAVNGAAAVLVLQEDAGDAGGELLGHLVQVHLPARAGRAFDDEVVAVVGVV